MAIEKEELFEEYVNSVPTVVCPVGWGCRIHRGG